MVGVPIGYFAHKKDAPFKFSTVIAPIVGVENLDDSYFARLVDLVAVFGTMGGIATSLGFIGQQLLMGMDYQFGSVRTPSASASALPLDIFGVQLGDLGIILVIIGVTTVFTLSVISGVEKGIKRLSQLNVIVFVSLGVLAFFIGIYNGMASFVLNLGTQAIGQYFDQFIKMSLFTGATTDSAFVGGWTVFYWAWWFSWAPFSGIFLAKISYGRTIREVTFVGVIATTLATVPWFLVIGGMSMRMQQLGQADILGVLANYGGNEAVSGYPLFGALPAGALMAGLFFLLVITFFVTSADSSTLGIAMLTTGGKESPSELNRLIWGVLQGLVAAVLIVIGGPVGPIVDALPVLPASPRAPFHETVSLLVCSDAIADVMYFDPKPSAAAPPIVCNNTRRFILDGVVITDSCNKLSAGEYGVFGCHQEHRGCWRIPGNPLTLISSNILDHCIRILSIIYFETNLKRSNEGIYRSNRFLSHKLYEVTL
ncbi:BCCT family transporter [Haladaptatus sp. W1]|uniref:BCCT family transporter n=1 Tax=Haladaptatus sp. W1 TaxID=1897478 RepID=UPI0020C77E70|nr:BCCT family transporter [Haladaptatus sp. W1]